MPAVEWPEVEQRIAEVARTKRGRHRDRALASWRRTRAIELRASGMSYDQIAGEVGYTSRATAYNVVKQALEAREAREVEMMRQLHLDRLESLVASLFPRAKQGHVPSILALLRILDQQMRLLGLSPGRRKKTPQDSWPSCVGPATVVVHPRDCRWEGCDRHGKFGGEAASPLTT